MSKFGLTLSIVAIASLISLQASACGESLYRVGKGVLYREYSAPLPAKILMVANTDGQLAMAEVLTASGHDVHIVAAADQIGEQLSSADHEYDLIMSMYALHEIVQSEKVRVDSSVAYLPVALADSDELSSARELNRYAPLSSARMKAFLKAIHRTMREGRV
jgi:hypothetical protein